VQPDFYYDRDGMPGVCVFVDGPHHDSRQQAAHDREARAELRDRGYRVIAIRHDRPIDEQVSAYPEVFAGT
jgi:very-short-patch-repair endonuclease